MSSRDRQFRGSAVRLWGSLLDILPSVLRDWLREIVLKGLSYRYTVGVLAIIKSPDGKRFLIVRHVYPLGEPGVVWGLPGGIVGQRNIETALKRELHQELGADIIIRRLVAIDESQAPRLDFYFECTLSNTHELNPKNEISSAGYFSLDNLPKGMYPRHLAALHAVSSHLNEMDTNYKLIYLSRGEGNMDKSETMDTNYKLIYLSRGEGNMDKSETIEVLDLETDINELTKQLDERQSIGTMRYEEHRPDVESSDSQTTHAAEDPYIRKEVFISYSHKDRKWLDRLRVGLKPYVREFKLETWDDTHIKPGTKWKDEIEQALTRAKVAVLLVSPDFLASDFIATDELPPLLDAAEKEGLTILWVAVSTSSYKVTAIGKYQAANDPNRPLNSLTLANRDKIITRVCEQIYAAATSQSATP